MKNPHNDIQEGEQKTNEATATSVTNMDRNEFACQFQASYGRLWLVAAGLVGDRIEADDIVQESAVIAFRKLNEFQSGTNFSAWVTEIVKRCSLNYRKKSKRRRTFATDPTSLDQETDQHVNSMSMDVSTGLAHLDSAIDDAMFGVLNQLSDEARSCLLLRVVEGLSYEQISSSLGIPTGTAMSHVFRSKKFARERLSDGVKEVDR